MLFPQQPLEKFIDEHISLQKIFRTSLIALYIFFLFYLLPAENLSFSITTFRNFFFFSFFAASQKIWSSVLEP